MHALKPTGQTAVTIETPILFLVFNRPDVTQVVFEEIRKARPKQLFIAGDGPRSHVEGDADRCQQVRDIFKNVDWDCEVKTNFREENLGCGKAVSGALTWFFQHVDQGIILEDDCVPDPTFFTFCEENLQRYENDPRVMLISGSSFQKEPRGEGSYYFSRLAHIWGWATWKRVWDLYDFRILSYTDYEKSGSIKEFHSNPAVQSHFSDIFEMMHSKPIDTWDYQLFFKIVENNGLCINPNVNLVTNIGFGPDATHTLDSTSSNANARRYSIDKIIHPATVAVDQEADDYSLEYVFGVNMNPLERLDTVAAPQEASPAAAAPKRGVHRLLRWIARSVRARL